MPITKKNIECSKIIDEIGTLFNTHNEFNELFFLNEKDLTFQLDCNLFNWENVDWKKFIILINKLEKTLGYRINFHIKIN